MIKLIIFKQNLKILQFLLNKIEENNQLEFKNMNILLPTKDKPLLTT